MMYHVAIVSEGVADPSIDVVAIPAERNTRRIVSYKILDWAADTAPIRDLVTSAIASGLADAMIDSNGFHECCVAGSTPWLRVTREEAQQLEMF